MGNQIYLFVLIAILLFFVVVNVRQWHKDKQKITAQFRPDDFNGNPYRRYCRTCGQCQLMMSFGDELGAFSWWEPNGEIIDQDCACNNFTSYYG